MTQAATHIVLLGDSIFDNAVYTRGEPDVVTHLRTLLPAEARATLLAKDGATTGSMGAQTARIPEDATHLVISVGGNDAQGHIGLLDAPVTSTGDALDAFDERARAPRAPAVTAGSLQETR